MSAGNSRRKTASQRRHTDDGMNEFALDQNTLSNYPRVTLLLKSQAERT
jgi:hypothetical protein